MFREAAGAVGDLKGLATTSVRALRTRLELLAIEVKEEKAWAMRFILFAIAALYLLTFGLLLGILALVLFAAEENRPAILGICAGAFLAFGVGAAAWIYAQSRSRRPLFEETIAVLKGDEQGLRDLIGSPGDD
jgi:uncharacterized membrane protein YqjE